CLTNRRGHELRQNMTLNIPLPRHSIGGWGDAHPLRADRFKDMAGPTYHRSTRRTRAAANRRLERPGTDQKAESAFEQRSYLPVSAV
ncbi:MAG: hypothetical protein ACJ8FZ_21535, partial [Bradyrhizobium sp.]